MMARRAYWAILILSILIGIYFYGIAPDKFNAKFLVIFAIVPYLMFAGSVHGLIAHTLKPSEKSKGGSIYYVLIMGALFVALFLLHVFVILPLACPDFLSGLNLF
jgi:hypothetical protein